MLWIWYRQKRESYVFYNDFNLRFAAIVSHPIFTFCIFFFLHLADFMFFLRFGNINVFGNISGFQTNPAFRIKQISYIVKLNMIKLTYKFI